MAQAKTVVQLRPRLLTLQQSGKLVSMVVALSRCFLLLFYGGKDRRVLGAVDRNREEEDEDEEENKDKKYKYKVDEEKGRGRGKAGATAAGGEGGGRCRGGGEDEEEEEDKKAIGVNFLAQQPKRKPDCSGRNRNRYFSVHGSTH